MNLVEEPNFIFQMDHRTVFLDRPDEVLVRRSDFRPQILDFGFEIFDSVSRIPDFGFKTPDSDAFEVGDLLNFVRQSLRWSVSNLPSHSSK